MLVAISLLIPAAAQAAAPQTPALTGTNPTSPGLSSTPRVMGFADGVSPQVVHTFNVGVGGGAMTSAVNPGSTITIYADDPTCSDESAVAGHGFSLEFENSGIELTTPVKTGVVTTLYADQSDATGTSGCSAGFPYRQVTGPPSAPSLLSVSPVSPANDNSPSLIGNAEAESTVSIYATSNCSGAAIASGTASEFAEGLQVSVPDNSTTTFSAAAVWAGLAPVCSSSSITYQEVSPATGGEQPQPPVAEKPPTEGPAALSGQGALPAPHLRLSPESRANDNTPLVSGAAPGAATVRIFDNASCSGAFVAKGPIAQLAAGFPVQVADNTVTHFYGVAYDGAGRPSTCSPTPATYTEDSTPPVTRITLGPGTKTRIRNPVFRFTDTTEEIGTTFLCRIDKGAWKACQTPWRLPRLRRAGHVVSVTAVDAAGNSELSAVRRRFKVMAFPAFGSLGLRRR